MTILLKFKRLDDSAILPKYKTKGSAGFDLYVIEGGKLWPNERQLVRTGWAVEIPEGYEMQMRPRSGLALKAGISLTNSPGTIDSDYRGEIGIILENRGHKIFEWEGGDRLAQVIIAPVVQGILKEDVISDTERGAGGFGSTGV